MMPLLHFLLYDMFRYPQKTYRMRVMRCASGVAAEGNASFSCRLRTWARCGPYPCWSGDPRASTPWRTWCHYSRSLCCWTRRGSAPWTGTRSPLRTQSYTECCKAARSLWWETWPCGRCESSTDKQEYVCEISSSHGGEYEAQNLLGCTAVFLIECRPTFQMCLLPLKRRSTFN